MSGTASYCHCAVLLMYALSLFSWMTCLLMFAFSLSMICSNYSSFPEVALNQYKKQHCIPPNHRCLVPVPRKFRTRVGQAIVGEILPSPLPTSPPPPPHPSPPLPHPFPTPSPPLPHPFPTPKKHTKPFKNCLRTPHPTLSRSLPTGCAAGGASSSSGCLRAP